MTTLPPVPGFSVTVTVKEKMLDSLVAAPQSFINKTSGLLGVFNGDITDDLTSPDGTVLNSNLNVTSEKELFEKFGELCK